MLFHCCKKGNINGQKIQILLEQKGSSKRYIKRMNQSIKDRSVEMNLQLNGKNSLRNMSSALTRQNPKGTRARILHLTKKNNESIKITP